jgi:HD superfamily phosphohydrolase
MRVYDPIYGAFTIDEKLATLVSTPEVRRLSQVRLLNCLSPSLAVLGELRRYSHTLGVLHLATLVRMPGFSTEELTALGAAVLLHDIGTPPFGHLFEYVLREQSSWHHEAVIKDILWGFHAPENKAHQIFAGRTIRFSRTLDRLGVSRQTVEDIVTRRHPLSTLLFGTLDLDNLDNVVRMAWALGIPTDRELGTRLAAALAVGPDPRLRLPRSNRSLVENWLALRGRVYDTLVFDGPTVAAQAVLSRLLRDALREGHLTEHDWSLSDEALLSRLAEHASFKKAVSEQFLGVLPEMAFAVQVDGAAFAAPADANATIQGILRRSVPRGDVLGYTFVDKGVFQKECFFLDDDGTTWQEGRTSRSTVYYGFITAKTPPALSLCRDALQEFLAAAGVRPEQLRRQVVGRQQETKDDQARLPFPACTD